MEKQKNIPALRFHEFKGEWERKKIEDSIDFLSGYPFNGDDISEDSNGIPLMRGINITEGKIRHSDDIDRYYCGDTAKLKKYFLGEGDVVIGMDGSKVGKNSAIIDLKNANSLLVQRVARLREKEGSSISFISQHINSFYFHKYVDEVKTSSGIPHISASQIKEFTISFPSLLEQQKIAIFLTAVDEKLQALKQKKALLWQYKKGVMQKIFNQELHFKDKNGKEFPKWERKRLGDIGAFFSGGTPLTTKKKYFGGEIPFIRSGEINSDRTMQFITEEGLKNSSAKMVEVGDLIYALYGATSGEVAISKIKGAINQAILCIRTNMDNGFLYNYLILKKESIIKTYLQGGQGNLSADIIKSLKIPMSSKEEQTKIAKFLSAIDEKTNHCQTQIEKNEQYKNGLLQKMFVWL